MLGVGLGVRRGGLAMDDVGWVGGGRLVVEEEGALGKRRQLRIWRKVRHCGIDMAL